MSQKNQDDKLSPQLPQMFNDFQNSFSGRLSSKKIRKPVNICGSYGQVANSSRDAVLGKLFTPTVPLFTKQQNW